MTNLPKNPKPNIEKRQMNPSIKGSKKSKEETVSKIIALIKANKRLEEAHQKRNENFYR